jgi:hypothetical protein
MLGSSAGEVLDVRRLRQVAVHAHRSAERDEIRVEREVVAAVDANATDGADEVARQVTTEHALRARTGRSHVRVLEDRTTEEKVVVVGVHRGIEHKIPCGVLQLAHGTNRSTVRHEADTRQEPSSAVKAVVQVDQVVSGERTGDARATRDARTSGGNDAGRSGRASTRGQSGLHVEAEAVADLLGEERGDVDAGVLDQLAGELNDEAVLERAERGERVERGVRLGEIGALSGDRARGAVGPEGRDLEVLAAGRVQHGRNVEHRADETGAHDHHVVERRGNGSTGCARQNVALLELEGAHLATSELADRLNVRVVTSRNFVRANLSSNSVETRGALLVSLELLDDSSARVKIGADAVVLLLLLGSQVAILRACRIENLLRLMPRGLAKIVLSLDVLRHDLHPFQG